MIDKDFKLSFEYKLYMKSEQWKVMREMCLIRSGWVCEKCGRIGKQVGGNVTLHIHHKTYERFGMEDMEDLMCLCRKCHNNIHKKSF